MVKSILQYLLVLYSPNLHQLFIFTWFTDTPHGGFCPWHTFYAWVTMVRKKSLNLYHSTYWCYIHQTFTSCSSGHDLLIPWGGLCHWPSFHTWVTMVRKKWISLYSSTCTYWCYIHQTCTKCSSWHYLLMPRWGLCPWPTFQATVTKTQNGNSGAPVIVPHHNNV